MGGWLGGRGWASMEIISVRWREVRCGLGGMMSWRRRGFVGGCCDTPALDCVGLVRSVIQLYCTVTKFTVFSLNCL